MRAPETEKSLAALVKRSTKLSHGLRGSIEKVLIPLKEGILPLILSASSEFGHPILAVSTNLYPLHRLMPVWTRIH